eukprot:scaffold104789_cov40-Prasinocladus_malaysianus.AAC.1
MLSSTNVERTIKHIFDPFGFSKAGGPCARRLARWKEAAAANKSPRPINQRINYPYEYVYSSFMALINTLVY